MLPEVDLDPASNHRSKVKARCRVIWEDGPDAAAFKEWGKGKTFSGNNRWIVGNGLVGNWRGSVFLNGPYSDMLPWCRKANEEWAAGRLTEATFLVKLDPTTKWWRALVDLGFGDQDQERQVDLWLPRKRLQHIPPPRIRASTNNFASAIIHWRAKSWSSGRGQLDLHEIADLWK